LLECWPLVPKFAGSNPAKAVGFFGRKKIHSMPSFGGEVVTSVPCRRFAACKRSLRFTWKSESRAKLTGHFSPVIPSFTNRGFSYRLTWSASGDDRLPSYLILYPRPVTTKMLAPKRYEEQRGWRRRKCCGELGVTKTAASLYMHQIMMSRVWWWRCGSMCYQPPNTV
jgi:hypothetical protein